MMKGSRSLQKIITRQKVSFILGIFLVEMVALPN